MRGHVPVIVHLKTNSYESSSTVEKLSLKDVNWDEWTEDIEKESENINLNYEDPKLLLQCIEKILNETTEKHGKKIIISSHTKPYWNPELSKLSKQLRIGRKSFSYRNTDRN